ncbi:MAG TPA: TIGR01777 family oxidoreductase [Phycisphaerae bacterium]|nr:TIGR01777 family oxidoreductase [Phycisphaerae bacterium]
MHVLITGSSGLIGRALTEFLVTGGHRVTRLVRSEPQLDRDELHWDPKRGVLDVRAIEGLDAVVHLAGENIAEGRWTSERKRRIRSSRGESTRLLAGALAELARPPKVFVSASAIGYYGNRPNEILREDSRSGSGFLPSVCREWEAAVEPAEQKGIRSVRLRFGMVLSADGGALASMIGPFRMGVGGTIGRGDQYVSWVALDDAVGAIHHALQTEELAGAVNVVSPQSVTNRQFTKTLGRVLGRPTVAHMPAFAARLAFGQMADELLLSSARVEPARLLATGYVFGYPELEEALRHLLGRTDGS